MFASVARVIGADLDEIALDIPKNVASRCIS
jgi:hypothetical protein